jgi:hypothetical protein
LISLALPPSLSLPCSPLPSLLTHTFTCSLDHPLPLPLTANTRLWWWHRACHVYQFSIFCSFG